MYAALESPDCDIFNCAKVLKIIILILHFEAQNREKPYFRIIEGGTQFPRLTLLPIAAMVLASAFILLEKFFWKSKGPKIPILSSAIHRRNHPANAPPKLFESSDECFIYNIIKFILCVLM